MQPPSYKRHRLPPETIRLAVWLYFRSTTSLWDVEVMLAERIAANIRRARGRADSVWHLDEIVIRINGKRMFMWRASLPCPFSLT